MEFKGPDIVVNGLFNALRSLVVREQRNSVRNEEAIERGHSPFKKREEYSIDKSGFIYQISQDEFVHCSYSNPRRSDHHPITWMKGNKRIEQKIEYGRPFGVDKIIKKADRVKDKIVIVDSVKFQKGIKVYFYWFCPHYFNERDNIPNVSFAFPINEDYRSKKGIKFNVSIDELKKYWRIYVHDNFLFGITDNENSSTFRRYQSDSEEYLERNELPKIFNEAVIFNNWIFYLSEEGDLISVNMNDLSYETTKANLGMFSTIVGIDENGMVNVQSAWDRSPVHLFTAKLPEKYITEKISIQSVIAKKKRIEELERKVENEEAEKKELQQKYNKFLLRVRY